MRTTRFLAVLLTLTLCGSSARAYAAEASTGFHVLGDFFADFGVRVALPKFFVRPVGDVTSDDNTLATFSEWSVMPALGLGTPTLTFGKLPFGANLMFNATGFSLDHQLEGGKRRDLGTSVKGFAAYVVPTIFVIQGAPDPKEGFQYRLGLGAGFGYMNVSGDAVLTKSPDRERITIDQSGYGIAYSAFLEARSGPFVVTFSGAGPTLEDDYAFLFYDLGLTVSWSY